MNLQEVDAALFTARLLGDEHDVALLWAKRAQLLEVNFHPDQLVLVMGVTHERARQLVDDLQMRGHLQYHAADGTPLDPGQISFNPPTVEVDP